MFRIWNVQERGGYIIVVDPRETPIARRADLHLDLQPGTDLALANGIVNQLIEMGYIDEEFINKHTNGFEETKELVKDFTPEYTSMLTGVAPEKSSALPKYTEKLQMQLSCLHEVSNSSIRVLIMFPPTPIWRLLLERSAVRKPGSHIHWPG